MTETYFLPSHPSIHAEDRFSLLDGDELHVPFWDLLKAVLTQDVQSHSQLIDVLETISVCRTGSSITDYGFLRQYLDQHIDPSFYTSTWPAITQTALHMPSLFPIHMLSILSPQNPCVQLTRQQTACLIVHQFLCTLNPPSWQSGYQDFHLWYAAEQPHPGAVSAYLTALFTSFSRLLAISDAHRISYTLHTRYPSPGSQPTPLCELEVVYLPEQSTRPAVLGLDGGAAVISANKFIGFGRTGTQEEVHVGATPEACPAVLFTPPLRDDQVLVVRGCEAVVVIAGYGREARLDRVLDRGEGLGWADRTMLFADAAELDVVEHERLVRLDGTVGLADLLPGMAERELTKAGTAFGSAPVGKGYEEVYTGFWGCRTFGGNAGVKACIQWCAASAADVETLKFICNGEDQVAFGNELESFVKQVRVLETTATRLREVLLGLTVDDCSRGESSLSVIFNHVRHSTD